MSHAGMLIRIFLISFCFLAITSFKSDHTIYITRDGMVYFKSDAPLEIIEATSRKLNGATDMDKRTFAFTIEMESFEGFNNALQQEHFNENYMESHEHKNATFLGKIIEKVELTEGGEYTFRAKGKLKIHGVTQERIIKSRAKVTDGKLHIHSFFSVLLKEHDIVIPKIVNQKIAEEIQVYVEAVFSKNSP